MNKFMTMTAATAFTLISATAMAEPASKADLFKLLDTDLNQMVSEEEAQAHESVAAQFGKLDNNQDKNLSMDEFSLLEKS